VTYDAVVVGAGIVGAACAHYLAKDNLKVAVVEPGPIGGGATAAGMGHLVVMDDSPAQLALTKYSVSLWKNLGSRLPKNAEVEHCGTIWVAADEEEFSFLPAKQQLYRGEGLTAEVLNSDELAEAEPNLRRGLAGGLRIPGDSVVYPMPVSQWLLKEAEVIRQSVRSISPGAVALSDGSTINASVVINAAGGRAPELTAGLPIQPRKGQLVITDRYPGFVNHQLVELGYLKSAHKTTGDSVAFNVQPRLTGQLLIGSSRQFAGWDSTVDHEILARMLSRAIEFMPSLGNLSGIRTWTGFRAATPDKLPLIGVWEPGIYVAAGHEGLGITTSLATGKMIADMVSGRPCTIDPTPFHPRREVTNGH